MILDSDLATLEENWDGRGSPAPSPALIAYAREALTWLQAGGLRWTSPHIGVNERGQIVLEWWQEGRSLTVFIRSEDQVDYLKAWGSNIVNEMEDGTVSRIADFVSLSRWLYQDEAQAA